MVHRCGLKPNDAPYMCLEENTSMSAIEIEALTLKVCADFGLCVLHVCDIDTHMLSILILDEEERILSSL